MTLSWIEPAKFALDVIKTAGIAAAGAWGYYLFFRQRTLAPRVEFDVQCRFFGPQSGRYAAEISLVFANKSTVRQEVSRISVRVLGIEHGAKFDTWEAHEPRLSFPIQIVRERNIIPEKYRYFFAEAGITQPYVFVTTVPDTISTVLIRAAFKYSHGGLHTAERVFAVKDGSGRLSPHFDDPGS